MLHQILLINIEFLDYIFALACKYKKLLIFNWMAVYLEQSHTIRRDKREA